MGDRSGYLPSVHTPRLVELSLVDAPVNQAVTSLRSVAYRRGWPAGMNIMPNTRVYLQVSAATWWLKTTICPKVRRACSNPACCPAAATR